MGYRLSIIVPIFNVEKYISRCAASLIKQTASKSDYEVVFVNDGTNDNSIEVLQHTVDFSKLSNIRLLHKENGGLSSARNYGIKYSNGDYIWFVDSDDWIEPNSVETILGLIDSYPDIVFTSQMFKNVGKTQSLKYKASLCMVAKGVDFLEKSPPSCAVAYVCKRVFLDAHNFRFKEGICFEDSELTPKMLYMAERVIATDIPLYHHFMREGSITHSINKNKIDDFKEVLESLVVFYKTNVCKQDKVAYSTNISAKIITFLDYSQIIVGKTDKDADNFVKANKELRQMLIRSSHAPTRLYGCLLSIFPSKATTIYYLMNRLIGRKNGLRTI